MKVIILINNKITESSESFSELSKSAFTLVIEYYLGALNILTTVSCCFNFIQFMVGFNGIRQINS